MKQNRLKIFGVCLGIMFVVNTACAADATATNNQNTDQMLAQVRSLQEQEQARQQQRIAEQEGATATAQLPQMQGQLYNQQDSHTDNPHGLTPKRPPRSSFVAPFESQQIRQTPTEKMIQDQAFGGAAKSLLPMTPQQIHRLRQLYTASQYAAAAPAGVPPKPVATSIYVNLSPGATPPVIRLSEGFVSSLVFLDSTGASWPIAAYDIGNPQAFDIAWDKKDNVLMIQAKTLYTYGNLAIRLRGLVTPIMLTLVPGQSVVDYRADITIPGYGPDAKALPITTGLPSAAAPVLLDVLDGIPPKHSKTLDISEDIGQVWEAKNRMYLRTQYTLLSPGWLATMSSADGTHAYELQKTPRLLISRDGKIVHVTVKGF